MKIVVKIWKLEKRCWGQIHEIFWFCTIGTKKNQFTDNFLFLFIYLLVITLHWTLENKTDLTIPILFNIHAWCWPCWSTNYCTTWRWVCHDMNCKKGKMELYFNYGSLMSWEEFYMKNWLSKMDMKTNNNKFSVCIQWKALEECFKICHILLE